MDPGKDVTGITPADAPPGFVLPASDPLSQLIARPRRAHSLASVDVEMKRGILKIGAAGAALANARSTLRDMKAHLLTAAVPGADRAAIQHDILGLRNKLRAIAASADVEGLNLVVIPKGNDGGGADLERMTEKSIDFSDENALQLSEKNTISCRLGGSTQAESALVRIVSALARGTAGGITISEIDIDRSVTALFDDRVDNIHSGIIDRIDPNTGGALATLDIGALTDTKRDQSILDRFVLQADAAIINIGAAASHLSIAQSRINLQSSFIMSLSAAVEAEPPTEFAYSTLDHLSAKQRAIETQRLLGDQPLSIANLNSQTVLKLFRGT